MDEDDLLNKSWPNLSFLTTSTERVTVSMLTDLPMFFFYFRYLRTEGRGYSTGTSLNCWSRGASTAKYQLMHKIKYLPQSQTTQRGRDDTQRGYSSGYAQWKTHLGETRLSNLNSFFNLSSFPIFSWRSSPGIVNLIIPCLSASRPPTPRDRSCPSDIQIIKNWFRRTIQNDNNNNNNHLIRSNFCDEWYGQSKRKFWMFKKKRVKL